MAHDGKVRTITAFVQGVEALKLAVKEDAIKLVKACPLEVLADENALADYLEEMLAACLEKHLLTPKRKIRPGVAKLIRAYVDGMQK